MPIEQNPSELRQEALNKIRALPLYFEANEGQVDRSVRYLSRSGRCSLFLTDDAAVFAGDAQANRYHPKMGDLVIDDSAVMEPQSVPLTGTGK